MDHKSYNHAVHSAAKSPVGFEPPSASRWGLPSGSSTPSSSSGSMNYSPRHSCKPSSLLSSRNINIQRLLLDTNTVQPSSVLLPPKKGKPLAIFIPSGTSPTMLPHNSIKTPVQEHLPTRYSPNPLLASAYATPQYPGSTDVNDEVLLDPIVGVNETTAKLRSPINASSGSPEGFREQTPSLSLIVCLDNTTTDNLIAHDTPCGAGAIDRNLLYDEPRIGSSLINTLGSETPETLMMPEELQEVGLTSAYPQGPANVLNSVLYLYSDPKTSGSPIDINDFDLVVNVARECDDLSADFDDRSGTRKYLRVPWSHTSAILKELPTITQEIAAMDKPGKKILVHCQCGVLRSACVVVAYFMVKFKISVNEAYELLKSGTESDTETCSQKIRAEGNFVKGCERICPNMSLIFELMDFGDKLQKDF